MQGTNYTNSTGRVLIVYVSLTAATASSFIMAINGVAVVASYSSASYSPAGTLLVPPGATYYVSSSASALSAWYEY